MEDPGRPEGLGGALWPEWDPWRRPLEAQLFTALSRGAPGAGSHSHSHSHTWAAAATCRPPCAPTAREGPRSRGGGAGRQHGGGGGGQGSLSQGGTAKGSPACLAVWTGSQQYGWGPWAQSPQADPVQVMGRRGKQQVPGRFPGTLSSCPTAALSQEPGLQGWTVQASTSCPDGLPQLL